jgi:type IV secretory pathway TrbD component
MTEYTVPVHKALQEPDVVFGIGSTALITIITVTVVLSSTVSIWCVLLGLIALIVTRQLCHSDPYLVDILFDNLLQPDMYKG